MKRHALLLIFALLGLAQVAKSQSPDNPAAQPLPLDPAVKYGTLENGMKYYIRANQTPKGRAEFYIVHNVGAILEEDAQNGLAHFLEHMAFNGTKHFPGKKLLSFLEKNGVKFGADVNAFTAQDMTCYNISAVPTDRSSLLDSCVLVLADWSGDISLEDGEINAERGVIQEELRTRMNASYRAMQAKNKVLFGDSKYAERNVIGTLENLRGFKPEVLRDFYDKWYRTDKQALIIVGDFDAAAMEERVKKIASQVPAAKGTLERPTFAVKQAEGVDFGYYIDPEVRNPTIEIYYKQMPPLSEMGATVGALAADVTIELITRMLNNRFDELSVKPDAPFVYCGSGYGNMVYPMDVFICRSTSKTGQIKASLEAQLTELQRARQHGFTQGELSRAVADMNSSLDKELAEKEKLDNQVFVWRYFGHFLRNEPAPSIEVKTQLSKLMLQNLPLQAINEAAKQLLDGTNLVVFVTANSTDGANMPTEESTDALVKQLYSSNLEAWKDDFVAEPLVAGIDRPGRVVKSKANSALGATEWTLSNGAKVILKRTDFKDDEVLLYGRAFGGQSLVETPQVHAAQIASNYVDYSGLGKFDRNNLIKQLAGKNVSMSVSFDSYDTRVRGSSTSSLGEIEVMLQLLYLQFTAPRFDEEAGKALLSQYASVLANQESNPDFQFQRRLIGAMSQNNPRRMPITSEDVKKIDLKVAESIYKSRLASASGFTFTLVGNFEAEQIRPLVEKYIGALPAGSVEGRRDNGIRFPASNVKDRFTQPMVTPKSSVSLVWNGKASTKNADYMMAEAVSGVLDLLCTEKLREEQGGTYGVGTFVLLSDYPMPQATVYFQFDTAPEKVDTLLPIAREIYNGLSVSIRPEDLVKVKSNLLKQHAQDVRTNRYWGNVLTNYGVEGINRHSDYEKQVNGLTPSKVSKWAKKTLQGAVNVEVVMDGHE